MTTSAATPVTEGQVLAGKYVVEKVLGAGGMGVVVAARHLQLGSRVALKFVLDEFARNPMATARFIREAQSVTRITSEHVAHVLDVGQLETGAPYMVMEYLEGSDLARLVETRGPLPYPVAIEYMLQACHALAEAHAKGIVHRDIKPSNLFLVRRFDGSPLVKVLDFGIAKVADTDENAGGALTQTHAMMGSPLYASPEQLEDARRAGQPSDIWSLGVSLHFLVTGKHPFAAESNAKLVAAIMMGQPTPLRQHRADLPEALERVVSRCLERDPSQRFGSVSEFTSALMTVLHSTSSDGSPWRAEEPSAFAETESAEAVAPARAEGEIRTTSPQILREADAPASRPRRRAVWIGVAVAVGAVAGFLLFSRSHVSHESTESSAGTQAHPAAPAPPSAGNALAPRPELPKEPAITVQPAPPVVPAPSSAPSESVAAPIAEPPPSASAAPYAHAAPKPKAAPKGAARPVTARPPPALPSASPAPPKPHDIGALIDERR